MHIPCATYRIQFCPDFGFRDAAGIVPYLAGLGISDVYASPIFKARAGSRHGYDVVDPTRLNPELGSSAEFEELFTAVSNNGLFWLQDIVPNHMAYSCENEWLMDVLESGRRSAYYQFFDIDWNHPDENMHGRVIAPVLDKLYADALEGGEIKLSYDRDGFGISCCNAKFPLRVDSYVAVLEHNIALLQQECSRNGSRYEDFLDLISRFRSLDGIEDTGVYSRRLRHAKAELWQMHTEIPDVTHHINTVIDFYNGNKRVAESYNALDELLSRQRYRLAFWKVVAEEINYRRFFTINDLISVNVEKESVFEATHAMIIKFARSGIFSGLRIDHIDGLYNPEQYLYRLRKALPDTFLVVEKILGRDEQLACSWPVQGTTGYDMLNVMSGICCRRENRRKFCRIYDQFSGYRRTYDILALQTKQLIIGKHLAGSIDNLAWFLKSISQHDRHGRDITIYGLKRALVEVMAQYHVYRTYISGRPVRDMDRCCINQATDSAKATSPAQQHELDFIRKFLLLEWDASVSDDKKKEWIRFAMMFQQYTGPVMAKAIEDTLFYRYNVLLSLNEVGGDPAEFGKSLDEFHEFNLSRAAALPYSFNASSTHDTKRGEDMRARLQVLSEMPEEWKASLGQWRKMNRRHKTDNAPDRNDEYFIYQTLIGSWPFDGPDNTYVQRIKEYIVKAVREAKVHTAWVKPDTAYEQACTAFIERILTPVESNRFLASFAPLQKKIAFYGQMNSLGQIVLKISCPGVPDFYQGTELWDLCLVDPDNRMPVDYRRRTEILAYIKEKAETDIGGLISELLVTREDGRVKLFLIYRLLEARRKHRQLFQSGDYLPLKTGGSFGNNIIAFARKFGSAWAVSIVPRFLTGVVSPGTLPVGSGVWQNTSITLPGESALQWVDAVTGKSYAASDVLAAGDALGTFPAALLVGRDG